MMKIQNKMSLEFSSISENEAFARLAVSAFVLQKDPLVSEIEDIKTAVSEAVTNSIVHGYDGEEGIVRIDATLYEDRIEINVKDTGKGIDNIDLAKQPMYTSKPNDERSGLGFTVMETFMDELIVESRPNVGTQVKMVKYFVKSNNE